jgi:hypothetical protein
VILAGPVEPVRFASGEPQRPIRAKRSNPHAVRDDRQQGDALSVAACKG